VERVWRKRRLASANCRRQTEALFKLGIAYSHPRGDSRVRRWRRASLCFFPPAHSSSRLQCGTRPRLLGFSVTQKPGPDAGMDTLSRRASTAFEWFFSYYGRAQFLSHAHSRRAHAIGRHDLVLPQHVASRATGRFGPTTSSTRSISGC